MPWCLQVNRKVPVWLYNATHSKAKTSSDSQSSASLYDTISGNSTFEHLQHALEAGQFIQRLYKVPLSSYADVADLMLSSGVWHPAREHRTGTNKALTLKF